MRHALACDIFSEDELRACLPGQPLRVATEFEEMLVFCSMTTHGCLNRHLPCNLKNICAEFFERQVGGFEAWVCVVCGFLVCGKIKRTLSESICFIFEYDF